MTPRVAPALLLAAMVVPFAFGAWPPAVFAGWALAAAGLVVAWRAGSRTALAGLACLAVLVGVTVVGAGVSFGARAGARGVGALEDAAAATAIATLWLPAGVYALAPRARPGARLAAVGVALIALWVALFTFIVVRAPSGGGAHFVVFALGALLVTAALVWRVWRPEAPRAAPEAADAVWVV